ncbi:MAG TPA: class I SAM-dependent methyltransferase [Vicinamibacterales bacterium]|jgi:SAM-dependent methyltransferase
MQAFTRDDGRTLPVIEGYRERLLSERSSYSPRSDWSPRQFAVAARKKLKRTGRFLADFASWGGRIEGARVLDVGCGDGIHCLLMALWPVRSVAGIDMELPLLEAVERRDRVRRLTSEVCAASRLGSNLDAVLERLPLQFFKMDASAMAFQDGTYDLLVSRSAIEHIRAVEKAFDEMARVVRPGGLIYLSTDPYFFPRGCHKSGVVDIPWAHARLTLDEYRRFVTEREGHDQARRRCRRLETLNPYTLREWREKIDRGPFEVLQWREEHSAFADALLDEYPQIIEGIREGVERRDLISERLKMWLRRR